MHMRDALNCKWEKRWAHAEQIILIENFHLCTEVQRQNIESGFTFFSAEQNQLIILLPYTIFT